jgi:uncharacterized repeat protein (TIGR01451 family)
VMVKDINPAAGPGWLTNVAGTLYFTASDGSNGAELWRSDGTAAGTVMVKDINPGQDSGQPEWLTDVGGTLYFAASDDSHGRELWRSDGTAAGTVMVSDINPGSAGGYPQFLTDVGGTLLFQANDGESGTELWRSDGTADGTYLVADIFGGPPSSIDGGCSGKTFTEGTWTTMGGVLYFAANEGVYGPDWCAADLWRSDGTEAGTYLIHRTNTNPYCFAGFPLPDPPPPVNTLCTHPGSNLQDLTNVGGTLFFQAYDDDHAWELWKSDGTDAGTVLVKDINPGPFPCCWSRPEGIFDVGGTAYFSADDGSILCTGVTPSDVPIQGDSPCSTPGSHGRELWQSDGTEAGTVLVKDINTTPRSCAGVPECGTASSMCNYTTQTCFDGSAGQRDRAAVGDSLFFVANDGSGTELWRTTSLDRPAADLQLYMTDSPDPVTVGSDLSYEIDVSNSGPDDASGVTVTDTLPDGAKFVSASASQGSCSGETTVTCSLGLLSGDPETGAECDTATDDDGDGYVNDGCPAVLIAESGYSTCRNAIDDDSDGKVNDGCPSRPNAPATVDIVVQTTKAGPLTNVASASAPEVDPNGANNSGVVTTTVNPHEHPIGASPLRVSLVPAFKGCEAANVNSTHGDPLDFGGCNPPERASSTARLGPGSIGFANLLVCNEGATPVNCNNESRLAPPDMRLFANLRDVRCTGNVPSGCSAGGDYNPNGAGPYTAACATAAACSDGSALARPYCAEGQTSATACLAGADLTEVFQLPGSGDGLRITDTYNGPGADLPATVTDTGFPIPIDCLPTPSQSSLGSTCVVNTSANALVPGVVRTGDKAVWQLGQIAVLDSGPDGTRGNSDDEPLAVQGIYVP